MVMGVEFINFSASFIQVFVSLLENPNDPKATQEVISGMKKDKEVLNEMQFQVVLVEK
jgi:hypothetical protein